MRRAPTGAVVRIFVDGGQVLVGEALRTPTGRTYLVVERRVQERGKHVGRQHLACVVNAELEPSTRVVSLRWYRRRRKAVA
jgi:predicted transcriptional regulator